MIAQLQFGHVIDCKVIIGENTEPPRQLIRRKAQEFGVMHGDCLCMAHSIQGSTSPCKLTTEMLPAMADSTCQAKLSYTVAGPRIR